MRKNGPLVAIDGPAGAGKSTVTRRVAQALGFLVLDTGALYRSVAWAAARQEIDWSDAARVAEVGRDLANGRKLRFVVGDQGDQKVWLGGEDISTVIRSQRVSEGASRVSAHPEVRAALLELQRQLGRDGGMVVEGRDIGTVVFPDAEVKFFLSASPEIRAQRRTEELRLRGEPADYETVLAEVRSRDERDRTRDVAPLRQATDARLVDSSQLTISEVVEEMVNWVRSVAQGAKLEANTR